MHFKFHFKKKFLIDARRRLPAPKVPKPQSPESTAERPEDQIIKVFSAVESSSTTWWVDAWTQGHAAAASFLVGFHPYRQSSFFWKRKRETSEKETVVRQRRLLC